MKVERYPQPTPADHSVVEELIHSAHALCCCRPQLSEFPGAIVVDAGCKIHGIGGRMIPGEGETE
jgi:hypothetical protein